MANQKLSVTYLHSSPYRRTNRATEINMHYGAIVMFKVGLRIRSILVDSGSSFKKARARIPPFFFKDRNRSQFKSKLTGNNIQHFGDFYEYDPQISRKTK